VIRKEILSMGLLSWFTTSPSDKFFNKVEEHMRMSIHVPSEILNAIRTSKVREAIERSRQRGEKAELASLRTSVGLYASYVSGNADQRALANRFYMPLKMYVGNAELGGSISPEEAAYCDALIGNAFRESTLKHGL
jgi:hypothetical protein